MTDPRASDPPNGSHPHRKEGADSGNQSFYSRRSFLRVGLFLVVTSGAALALFRRDLLQVLKRWLNPWLNPYAKQGTTTLDDSELADLAALTATLCGLSSSNEEFTAYVTPIIQRAAQTIGGRGQALRNTALYLSDAADPDFRTLSEAEQRRIVNEFMSADRPSEFRIFAWIRYMNIRLATDQLLRIGLNSPQSWARFGYTNYPGVYGDPTDYQRPISNPSLLE